MRRSMVKTASRSALELASAVTMICALPLPLVRESDSQEASSLRLAVQLLSV